MCGIENPEGADACKSCGNSLGAGVRHCVSCGRSIGFDVNVCPYCGHDFRIAPQGPVRESFSTGIKVLLYLVSLFVPVVGIIIGIVLMTRDDLEHKQVGKICLILGVVSALLTVGLSALLYVMVLDFSNPGSQTPTTVLIKDPVVDGWKFTLGPINSAAMWSDASIIVVTVDVTASWSPTTSELTGDIGTIADYDPVALGDLSVTLTVMDLSGNGRLDQGDYFILTSSPAFSFAEYYSLTLLYEPSDGPMAESTFSG